MLLCMMEQKAEDTYPVEFQDLVGDGCLTALVVDLRLIQEENILFSTDSFR